MNFGKIYGKRRDKISERIVRACNSKKYLIVNVTSSQYILVNAWNNIKLLFISQLISECLVLLLWMLFITLLAIICSFFFVFYANSEYCCWFERYLRFIFVCTNWNPKKKLPFCWGKGRLDMAYQTIEVICVVFDSHIFIWDSFPMLFILHLDVSVWMMKFSMLRWHHINSGFQPWTINALFYQEHKICRKMTDSSEENQLMEHGKNVLSTHEIKIKRWNGIYGNGISSWLFPFILILCSHVWSNFHNIARKYKSSTTSTAHPPGPTDREKKLKTCTDEHWRRLLMKNEIMCVRMNVCIRVDVNISISYLNIRNILSTFIIIHLARSFLLSGN